jgi:hypothetical protein
LEFTRRHGEAFAVGAFLAGAHILPFVLMFGVTAAFALVLSRLPATRRGAAWLQGSN